MFLVASNQSKYSYVQRFIIRIHIHMPTSVLVIHGFKPVSVNTPAHLDVITTLQYKRHHQQQLIRHQII